MRMVSTLGKITLFDWVELAEAIDDAPLGARGGVLELRDGDIAMVEIMEPSLDGIGRIVFAPLRSLRLIETPAAHR